MPYRMLRCECDRIRPIGTLAMSSSESRNVSMPNVPPKLNYPKKFGRELWLSAVTIE